MFSKISNIIRFYFGAVTKYDVHSPIVFDFIQHILEDDRNYYAFRDLEQLRHQLLTNKDTIEVEDFGAGSSVIKSNRRKIATIAGSSLTRPSFCRLLFKMTHHYKPLNIIELGTSFGLATLYMAKANEQSKIFTIEGASKIADIAQLNFDIFKAKNIEIRRGNINNVLPEVLKKIPSLDMIFLDGNHQKQPTIDYFEQSLPFANEKTIFIFDDIYWSAEMTEAWETIKKHPKVTLSIDIYQFGVVFINKEVKEKQHFKLVPYYLKPWRMGFF
jgi:predicted O-methyltransferase YrrM